ncbi:MAG: FAD-dependent oxidoreductase [Candidatus Rokubacteria bacterium]|nr:FAD-dependent oxidoreductase [Candidatus Rokubacteria bacterium]
MTAGILGGGLAGLAVAAHLEHPCEVLEQEERPGGHCLTVVEDGFTWDAGGPHIMFSRNEEMLAYMVGLLGPNVRRGRRANKILFKGRYVKYPFENGLGDLDPEDRFECLYHYLVNDAPPPTNFKEWLYHTFGTGLTEKYLLPYNEKIWKVRAEQIALDWVEGRVPKPPLADVVKAAVGVQTEGYTHQLHFHYPERGGIESLPTALVPRVPRIVTGFTVRHVRRQRDRWVVSDGHRERTFERLVATIPLDVLADVVDGVPAEVRAAVAALRYNSLITVALGVEGEELPDYTAVYIPDPRIRTHRISFPAAFSPHNVPRGRSMVVAEITTNAGDGTWEMADAALVDDVATSLEAIGLLRRSRLCYARVVRSAYGYVVQDSGYRLNVARAKAWFEAQGIVLCGRVAEFEYINMDVCLERGIARAQQLRKELA